LSTLAVTQAFSRAAGSVIGTGFTGMDITQASGSLNPGALSVAGSLTLKTLGTLGSNGDILIDSAVNSTGAMLVQAAGTLRVTGDARNAWLYASGTAAPQTVTAQDILLEAGAGGRAQIYGKGDQSVSAAGTITLRGGGTLTNRFAAIDSEGSLQTVAAQRIEVFGGAAGGTLGSGNRAGIFAHGSQQLNIGAGGLLMQAGGGTGDDTDNLVFVDGAQAVPGAYQRITLTGGGGITMIGGNSAKVNVGDNGGSHARIQAGTSSVSASEQLIQLNGGTVSLTGGSAGSRAFALIFAEGTASQTIQGASTISLTGGAGGGTYNTSANVDEGNRATVENSTGAQSINAGVISLTGGGGGTLNYASISSSGPQTITGTLALNLTGGSGGGGTLDNNGTIITVGNRAYVFSNAGQSQSVSAGSISVMGGGGSLSNN
jgi:hypothetical protein